jgi:hypothetical protein
MGLDECFNPVILQRGRAYGAEQGAPSQDSQPPQKAELFYRRA